MKVEILKHARLNNVILNPGQQVEIPDDLIRAWEKGGFAKRLEDEETSTPEGEKTSTPEGEKTSAPESRRKELEAMDYKNELLPLATEMFGHLDDFPNKKKNTLIDAIVEAEKHLS